MPERTLGPHLLLAGVGGNLRCTISPPAQALGVAGVTRRLYRREGRHPVLALAKAGREANPDVETLGNLVRLGLEAREDPAPADVVELTHPALGRDGDRTAERAPKR